MREKGLIPKDWNLRSLSGGQKSYITKQARKFSAVLKRPDDYVSRRASKATLAKMKLADFPVQHGRVLIHAPGRDRVSIARGKISYTRRRQRETVLLQSSPDFLRELEKLPMRRLPKGQYVGLKIGNSQMIATFHGFADLLTYATKVRKFNGRDAESLAVVLIDTHGGWEDDDEDEGDEDE